MSPPSGLPLRRAGTWRKRWRYLGAFSDEFMVCAARVLVGPFGQTFWAIWDRERRDLLERTVMRAPGARGEVWSEERNSHGIVENAPDEGCTVRIEAKHPEAGQVRGFLEAGPGEWAECVCANDTKAEVWTRKRPVPVRCDLRIGERHAEFDALGIEDESAGYHPRHTVWSWSAGVGAASDGRPVAWNLVEGVNDPPERSERAIWVDGEPFEPPASSFEALGAITFPGGERLDFSSEAVRAREENRIFVRSSYRQPFGTFTGTLPGGIELVEGLGVMEHHDAHW